MSNRSYLIGVYKSDGSDFEIFQFPVGMSNRSYERVKEKLDYYQLDFQFPVGMSNRSYMSRQVV